MPDTFYLTTAIHYPNGRPHIGHAYETIAADVLARFHRQQGRRVRFQTGTDEHGLKMAQKARDAGVEPKALADEMSSVFKDLFSALDITHDRFIRTTEAEHHRASQTIWRAMEANGDLYLDRYEGWYSVRDEAFYDESELEDDGEGGRLSPQGTPVEWTAEETWFFRLSSYGERLLQFYRDNPDFIQPDSRRNEVMRFVEGGLRDLSISRTSFDWGVPVPGSDGHVMYVWVDALTNYLTGLGYPDQTPDMADFWPADLHLVGKDITRFHAVYWPAFLMSAKIALPKQVYAHGFLLSRDGRKESKSSGNVTDPFALVESYGSDVLRYFLLREFSFGQDGSYSAQAIVSRNNSELANSFGNLAQRVLSFVAKRCNGSLAPTTPTEAADRQLRDTVRAACTSELPTQFEKLAFAAGLEAWMQAVYACNQYVDEQAPWALRKTDPARMERVLATLCLCIRDLAIAVSPVIPRASTQLLDALSVPVSERDYAAIRNADDNDDAVSVVDPKPVFPRLDLPVSAETAA